MYTNNQIKIKQELERKEAMREKDFLPQERDEDSANPSIADSSVFSPEFALVEGDRAKEKEFVASKLEEHLSKYDNPFPTEVFPDFLQQYIRQLEVGLNFPPEFLSIGILTAVSGAIGNKMQLELKAGQRTTCILYAVLIGKPGTNKSSPLERALQPLNNKEKEWYQEFLRDTKDDCRSRDKRGQSTIESRLQRCIANDITVEAMMELLEDNDITVYNDEFNSFLKSMNKYRKGDDMEKWLSIWSSKQLRSDRKGKSSKLITQPFANCIGTIQTEVLVNFLSSNTTNNGFIDRLLYVPLNRDIDNEWNDSEYEEEYEVRYHQVVNEIFNVKRIVNEFGDTEPAILTFTEQAAAAIMAWQNKNASSCKGLADNQLIGIYKKLELYVLRFCLILSVLDYADRFPKLLAKPGSMKIRQRHAEGAIKLVEYFRNTAKYIMTFVKTRTAIKQMDRRFIMFYKQLPAQFSTRKALEVGAALQLSERTVFYYLKSDYFLCPQKGKYEKRYYES